MDVFVCTVKVTSNKALHCIALHLMQLEGDKSRHLLRPGFEVGQRKRSSLSDPLPRTSVNKQVFRERKPE